MSSSNNQRLKSLIYQMTLEEKLAQINSYWFYELQTRGELDLGKVASKMKHGIGQITRVAGASTLDPRSAAKMANRLQKFLIEETRLGIPAILHEECCSGTMMLGGTVFPQMIGLAATFQPELAEAMTTVIRSQLLAIGARQGLAPVLDIARDPRWGRVEETFGEDPTLVSHFGVAYIKGLQGESLTEGVLATGKHFIGHSYSQGGLNCAPVHLGWREMYDVFMLPFQAAIRDAGLASMMNSYPELDGEVVAASRRILTDILRGQLGFEGLVVSDYEAVQMIHNYHRMAESEVKAAALALYAGIEVELPTIQCYTADIAKAISTGDIQMEWIDQAVTHHLEKKFELGLFENPFIDEGKVLEVFETPEQRRLALEIARQSMVLLSNDGLLPLPKSIRSIAVIGPNADSPRNLLGDYSYDAMKDLMIYRQPADSAFIGLDPAKLQKEQVKVISLLEAIRQKLPEVKLLYARGCEINSDDASGFAEAIDAANKADVVILALGDRSGMTLDCTCGETRDSADLRLPGVQSDLARAVLETGKPAVVVLVNGRPLAIPELAGSANAILEAWLPGEEGGAAIADVLFGDVNPGGKLAMTFPRTVGQVPIFYNHKPSGGFSHWYYDYVMESVKPMFSFGHGLSYTSFKYKDLAISPAKVSAGEFVEVSLTIENTGEVAGDEVIQLYCCDVYATSPRPVKELKGFKRLTLPSGGSSRVSFHLPVDSMAYYDDELNLIVEPGVIQVMVGSSSVDIRLQGEFEIAGKGIAKIEQRVYNCPVTVK